MLILLNTLLLSCFSLTTGTQDDFIKDLNAELFMNNSVKNLGVLSCGYMSNGVYLNCSEPPESLLTALHLLNMKLKSIPSSIADVQSLSSLTINNAGLSSLPSEIGSLPNLLSIDLNYNKLSSLPESMASLTQLESLQLDSNAISSFPDCFSSFSNLVYLVLRDNSLTTIPNSISSLTSLTTLYLSSNPSLEASTELFKEMKSLILLFVNDTLISGLLPEEVLFNSCSSTCISSKSCTKNPSCSCSSFFSDSCPDTCGVNSQQLCVECSRVVSKQCSGDCSWCSMKEDGKDCYWCDLHSNNCSDFSGCSVCSGYSTSSDCVSSGCHWCDYDYCVETVDSCEKLCSNLAESNCSSDLDCFWCSSYSVCLDSTSQCLSCGRFTSSFCPPGCDCSSSGSNSTVVIVVCVVCGVLFVICVCLFVLKWKTVSSSNEMNTFSTSNTSLRFGTDIEMIKLNEPQIILTGSFSEAI